LAILGLLGILRSQNISFLLPLRTKKCGLLAEGIIACFLGCVGLCGETYDMIDTHAYQSQTHHDHIVMYSMIAGMGIADILHRCMILDNVFWSLMPPAGVMLIGVLFSAHHNSNPYELVYHNVNVVVLVVASFSRIIELCIGLHTNKRFHLKVRQITQLPNCNGEQHKCKCCTFCLGQSFPDYAIPGVNPMYSNPKIYGTMFPMLTAYLLFLNGCWWWDMAYSFHHGPTRFTTSTSHAAGGESMTPTAIANPDNDMVVMTVLHIFTKYTCATLVILAIFIALLKKLDRKFCLYNKDSSAGNIEDVELIPFVSDSDFVKVKEDIE